MPRPPKNVEEKLVSQADISMQEKNSDFKKAFLESLGIESLKKEITEGLNKETSKTDQLLRHPATLLILGFILTTILGTFLTSWNQREEWNRQQKNLSNEWSRQQKNLSQQHLSEERGIVITEVINAVSETVSAADDVLSLYSFTPTDDLKVKRMETWEQSSPKWRNSYPVLTAKLKIYFTDSEVHTAFQDIIDKRNLIGNEVEILVTYLRKKKTPSKIKKRKSELLSDLNEIKDWLGHLTKIMTEEAIDERKPQSEN